ncbi:MAG: hypothetical protein AB1416_05305 [Actinomycetota bacterium]
MAVITGERRRRRGAGAAVAVAMVAGLPAAAAAAPVSSTPPAITTPLRYGDTARCTPGTWSADAVTFSYAWVFQGSTRGTGPTLKLDDPYYRYGVPLTCQVTATDAAGASTTATSAGVIPDRAVSTVRITSVKMLTKGRIEVRGVVGPLGLKGLLGTPAAVTLNRPYGKSNMQIAGPARVDARGRFVLRGDDAAGRRRINVYFTPGSITLVESAKAYRTVVFTPGGRAGGGGTVGVG